MQWKFGNQNIHHKHASYECTKNANNPLKTITKLENNKSKLIQIHSFTPKHQKMVFLEQTSTPYNWSPAHFLSTQNLPNQSMPQLLNTLWITSWSLMGPGVEVGLAPNIMKGINIFTADVIKDFPYNYDKIIQVLWKKGNKEKKILLCKCLKWCHMALWNFRLCFEPSGLPPLTRKQKR